MEDNRDNQRPRTLFLIEFRYRSASTFVWVAVLLALAVLFGPLGSRKDVVWPALRWASVCGVGFGALFVSYLALAGKRDLCTVTEEGVDYEGRTISWEDVRTVFGEKNTNSVCFDLEMKNRPHRLVIPTSPAWSRNDLERFLRVLRLEVLPRYPGIKILDEPQLIDGD